MEQFVRPINIPSPISGAPVAPRIIRQDHGDKIVVEAHWIDPHSGAFIRKGIVEIIEKKIVKENLESVEHLLLQGANGDIDLYDLANNPATETEQQAANIINSMYDEIAIEYGYHPDDDFESIFEIIAQRLHDQYGNGQFSEY